MCNPKKVLEKLPLAHDNLIVEMRHGKHCAYQASHPSPNDRYNH